MSFKQLEALLWASELPPPNDRCVWWRTSVYQEEWVRDNPEAAYFYKAPYWPWSVEKLWRALAHHRDHPRFPRLFGHFLYEIFPRDWHNHPITPETVLSVLKVAREHPEQARRLFDGISKREEARRAFVERRDLRATEIYLRHQLTKHMWAMTNRTWETVEDENGTYERAIRAVYFPGQDELLSRNKEAEGARSSSGGAPIYDCFDGKHAHYTYRERPENLAKMRRLVDLAGPDGVIAPGDRAFLDLFDPDYLVRRFRMIEGIRTWASHEQCLDVYEAFEERVEPALDLLIALLSYEGKKPPKPGWRGDLRRAAAPLGNPKEALDLCEKLWDLRGRVLDPPSEVITRASVWGVWALYEDAPSEGAEEVPDWRDVCDRLVHVGEKWIRMGNEGVGVTLAAARTLQRVGNIEAMNGLVKLSRSVKNKTALRFIEAWLEDLARAWGRDRETIEDLLAEDFGLVFAEEKLPSTGVPAVGRTWKLANNYQADLSLNPDGRVELRFTNTRTAREVRSLPKSARGNVGSTTSEAAKECKAMAKALRSSLSTQATRLEGAMVVGRSWRAEDWRATMGANPILQNLARRLVWRASYLDGGGHAASALVRACSTACIGTDPEANNPADVAFGEEFWCGDDGKQASIPEDAYLSVAHRISMPHEEAEAWRVLLKTHDVIQPFEQVEREVFVRQPGEDQGPGADDSTTTRRFAGSVVTHRKLYALLKDRGWSGMGFFGEGEQPAWKDYPSHACRVVLNREGYDLGVDEGGTEETIILGGMTFMGLQHERERWVPHHHLLSLADVPKLVFSEAVRDVSLFVARASAKPKSG